MQGHEFKDFDRTYLSFRLHLEKPDSKIFEFVLKDLKAQAEDVLFVDDLEKNIQTAADLGIYTIQVSPNNPDPKAIIDYLGLK